MISCGIEWLIAVVEGKSVAVVKSYINPVFVTISEGKSDGSHFEHSLFPIKSSFRLESGNIGEDELVDIRKLEVSQQPVRPGGKSTTQQQKRPGSEDAKALAQCQLLTWGPSIRDLEYPNGSTILRAHYVPVLEKMSFKVVNIHQCPNGRSDLAANMPKYPFTATNWPTWVS
ncbi:unnamed protein product [Penicillium pancosmium]